MDMRPVEVNRRLDEADAAGVSRRQPVRIAWWKPAAFFVRAFWQTLRVEQLTLYRGMSSDRGWRGKARAWSSWTPVQHVARCHADFDSFGQHRGASTDSYLFKRTFPVSRIFMSYFETDAFNRQWKETEVLVMHDEADRLFL